MIGSLERYLKNTSDEDLDIQGYIVKWSPDLISDLEGISKFL